MRDLEIDNKLQSERWPFVRAMIVEDEVGSTNDLAAALALAGRVEFPFGIWAKRQTRGRGRGQNSWWSDEGSLTFTVALDPRAHGLTIEDEPKLALATAVGAIEALDDLGIRHPTLGIRWPNDLEVLGKKFGGILPEIINVPDGRRILIGVGINVCTDLSQAPDEVRAMAIGLRDCPKTATERGTVPFCLEDSAKSGQSPAVLEQSLAAVLGRFESALARLAEKDPELARQWAARDLLRGHEIRLDPGASIIAGRAEGIDADGALLIDDGRSVRRFWGGRVLRSKAPSR